MRYWLTIPAAVLLMTPAAIGQEASASHLFPQVADGCQPDSFCYVSRLWLMNVSDASDCTIALYGLEAGRLPGSPSVTVPALGWAVVDTRGAGPLATGYVRLDCSRPVTASLTYSLLAPEGTNVGMATVMPSPLASYAKHPLLLGPGARYAVALANDSDATAVLNVFFTETGSGKTSIRTIQIAPRTQYSRFVDQIVNLPAEGSGTLEIEAVGTGPSSFRLTCLLFQGVAFTTLVPATVR
jgi:hypothetical protein